MNNIVKVLKSRLLAMRKNGADLDKQRVFVEKCIAMNKRQAKEIKAMAESVDPELVRWVNPKSGTVGKVGF